MAFTSVRSKTKDDLISYFHLSQLATQKDMYFLRKAETLESNIKGYGDCSGTTGKCRIDDVT